VWWLVALGASACAAPAGPGRVVDASRFTEATGREAEPLPETAVEAAGAFHASVPAALLAPPQRDGDAWTLTLGIGSEVPVQCRIHDGDLELAGSIVRLSQQQLGGSDGTRIERVDAGALAGSLFVAIRWSYRTRAAFGQVHHLLASKAGHAIHCVHDETGYAQSFRRVVEALVRSAVFADAPGEPFYEDIATIDVKGHPVGAAWTAYTREPDGNVSIETRGVKLVPMGPAQLRASDSLSRELSRPDGTLLRQTAAGTQNGEEEDRLDLDPDPAGGWTVRGRFAGKPFHARIASDAPVRSTLGEALALRDAVAAHATGGSVRLWRWMPGADPAAFTELSVRILDRRPDGSFDAAAMLGELEISSVVDASGALLSQEADFGHVQSRSQRVFTRGAY
jgi:hypothetical protein